MAADASGAAPDERYEEKDEAYFSYYAMLTHQAQMLQDAVRTSAYQSAILQHAPAFQGMSISHADRRVMDVGAGNGILSLFSIQAGAAVVYAVEASGVVGCLHQLAAAAADAEAPVNAWARDKLAVVHGRCAPLTQRA